MKTSPKAASFALAVTLATSALFFLPATATAQAAPAARGSEVRIDTSNMTPDAAHQRIAEAAMKVCRAVTVNSPLLPREYQQCRHDAENRARTQLAEMPKLLASRD